MNHQLTQHKYGTLSGMLSSLSERFGPSVALWTEEGATTFGELDRRADVVARALTSDLNRGARFGFLDRNSQECIELLFGASRSQTVLVPINWRLSRGELAAILEDSGLDLLVVGAEFLPLVREVLFTSDLSIKIVALGGDCAENSEIVDYGDWIQCGNTQSDIVSADPQETVLQIYTSGTTGSFKGVMHTETSMTVHLSDLAHMIGYGRHSVMLTAMPLFHVSGLGGVLLGLVNGGQTVLLRDADTELTAESIEKYRVTHGFFVPAVVTSLLDRRPVIDWSSFETVVYGGSPISEALLNRAMTEMGCSFVQLYGQTESMGATTLLPASAHRAADPAKLRSCGPPLPWVTVRIVDPETGMEVENGTSGEIWVNSPQNMVGYWNQHSLTTETLVDGTWLRTGDGGYKDSDGWIYIDGRIKEMIISGGENIYPAEIEQILELRDDIKDVAVVGVPHERWGESPVALVVPSSEHPPVKKNDLLSYCREHLAHYKCPSDIVLLEELPRNASGKVLRTQLKKLALSAK